MCPSYGLVNMFRCVCEERISIRGSVRPSVCRLVRPSALKIADFGTFQPFNKPHSKHTLGCFGRLLILSVCLSVCPSIPPYFSHVYRRGQYMQRHSQDALLPGRACFPIYNMYANLYKIIG